MEKKRANSKTQLGAFVIKLCLMTKIHKWNKQRNNRKDETSEKEKEERNKEIKRRKKKKEKRKKKKRKKKKGKGKGKNEGEAKRKTNKHWSKQGLEQRKMEEKKTCSKTNK